MVRPLPREPGEAAIDAIALRGARIDDLFLTDYRTTVDADAPPVELLRPEGAEHA
ncbi:MAG: YidC/Oxa1 family insertase periplasmic-domain containing protein, partial [Alphaproteobacteria bacterium]